MDTGQFSESSDDQGSLPSVIEVGDTDADSLDTDLEAVEGDFVTTDSEAELSVSPGVESPYAGHESAGGMASPALSGQHIDHEGDDLSSDSDGDETSLQEGTGQEESDSSSSSEETQIWVPVFPQAIQASIANRRPTPPPKPQPPPKPPKPSMVSRNSMTSSPGAGGNNSIRHSVVSQNSNTGRVEITLVEDEPPHYNINGDSGISNETSVSPCDQVSPTVHIPVSDEDENSHLPPSPPPPHSILKNGNRNRKSSACRMECNRDFRESLFNVLSGLYAMILVMIGACLPIAEIFSKPTTIATGFFEAFYVFLFAVSILFLTYVYLYLLREKTVIRFGRRNKNVTDSPSERRRLTSTSKISMDTSSSSHTGSFYLRLGAVGFGIGNMIHEGLVFGEVFEMDMAAAQYCVNVMGVVRPVMHLTFTFVQLYFIFLNSKMCIHKYKVLARFGLMHMIATNLCVWLRSIVKETIRDYTERYFHSALQERDGNGSERQIKNHKIRSHNMRIMANESMLLTTLQCHQHDSIMSNVVEDSSPYLYPCTIVYSMIAAGILYTMWKNIGKRNGRNAHIDSGDESDSNEDERLSHKNHSGVNVDCSGSNKGLFLGILTMVAAIISMIVFFVLVAKPGYKHTAALIMHVSEVTLHFLASIAICVAFYKIRNLKFHKERDNDLDEILLLLSLLGVYMFSVFSIVAGDGPSGDSGGTLIILTAVSVIIQSSLQTVFILNGLRRSSYKPYHENKKPGREYVTYLLVCNIAMWGINTFEVLRSDSNPVQLTFYGFLPWSIITHLTTPMTIFYRFHSTVCLANIWKNAYKIKTH